MLNRFLQQAPRFYVTTLVAAGCLAIFAATVTAEEAGHQDTAQMLGLGSPEEFWRGNFWRLPLAPLHHGNIVHLLCSVAAFWYLGRLAELLMGSARYFGFLTLTAFVTCTLSNVAGENGIGLTGVICAIFGMLLFIRPHNIVVTQMVPAQAIRLVFLLLLLCVPFNFIPGTPFQIPNVAHTVGLLYGFAFGWGLGVYRKPSRPRRLAFLAGHFFVLVPCFLYLLNPVMNEFYVFNEGLLAAKAGDADHALAMFERAADLNPDFAEAYFMAGSTAFDLKAYDKSALAFGRFLALDPKEPELIENKPEAMGMRVKALAALARFDEADKELDRLESADAERAGQVCGELAVTLGHETFHQQFPQANH